MLAKARRETCGLLSLQKSCGRVHALFHARRHILSGIAVREVDMMTTDLFFPVAQPAGDIDDLIFAEIDYEISRR